MSAKDVGRKAGRHRHQQYSHLNYTPESLNGKCVARCNICNVILKSTAETRLRLHRYNKCKADTAPLAPLTVQNAENTPRVPPFLQFRRIHPGIDEPVSMEEAAYINEGLANFFHEHGIPFNKINSPSFKEFIRRIRPGFAKAIPTGATLAKKKTAKDIQGMEVAADSSDSK